MAAEVKEKIAQFVNSLLDTSQYCLVGIEQSPSGRRISVYIDGDQGVNIDYCSQLSRSVSRMIDEDPGLESEEKFTFEISSPGVDRPLVHLRQLPKHIGRFVEFTADGRQHNGKLVAVTDGNFTIEEEEKAEAEKKKTRIVERTYLFDAGLQLKVLIKF